MAANSTLGLQVFYHTVFSGDHRETSCISQLPPIIVGPLNSQEPEKSGIYPTLFTSFTFSSIVNFLEKIKKEKKKGRRATN